MKNLLAILLCVSSVSAFAWTQRAPFPIQQCQVHAPYGFPQAQGVEPLCQQAYLVGYDAPAKLPRFVTYELLPKNALGCVARTNAFATNQFIPNGAVPASIASAQPSPSESKSK